MITRGCLDEAAIQAYLDGELAPEAMTAAARHTAACDRCASALDEAQGELGFFAAAFGAEDDLSVPTERLRARIEDAVAALRPAGAVPLKSERQGLGALVASLAGWMASPFTLAPRHAGAFAGLAALVALALIFGLVYMRRADDTLTARVGSGGDVAVVQRQQQGADEGRKEAEQQKEQTEKGSDKQPQTDEKTRAPRNETNAPRPQRKAPRGVIDSPTSRGMEVAGLERRTPPASAEPAPPAREEGAAAVQQQYLPGEANYLRTVASLEKMIEVGGDRALRPNMRADYERSLAVVDKAIEQTRRAALRNPKDQDAAAYLFSSYQTKIDLMRSLADQAQVATLGR